MVALPDPTPEDLRDEGIALVAYLRDRGVTERVMRAAIRKAYERRKPRRRRPIHGVELATDEDLLRDLEVCALGLRNRRSAMGLVTKGLRVKPQLPPS